MNFDIGLRKRFWAEIDMDAARENFLHIRSRLNSETRLCCVVKANAYGHGALYVSRLYEELGADTFAVSNIEEAMQLRKGGIKGDILILGYTPAECAEYLLEYRLIQTVYSYEYAQSLSKCVLENDANARLTVHIKLDTGMGRLGFRCRNEAELNEVVAASRLGGLYAEGVFTHFALADGGESGTEYTDGQYKAFKHFLKYVKRDSKISPICFDRDYYWMTNYPKDTKPLTATLVENSDGSAALMLVNPNPEKAQVQYYRGGEWWYIELLPDTLATVTFEK